MTILNILHTIPGRNWGGMEQRALEQVRWLVDHGHHAWYAAPPDGEPFRQARAAGVPVIPMVFDPAWRPDTMLRLRRFVAGHKVDIIDTHVTRDAKAAMACLDLCAVVRSRHVDQPLETTAARRAQWRLGSDHVITVAGSIRRHLIEIGLAEAERSTWVGGWAHEKFFAPPAVARADLRRSLGLADDVPVLLCVAMLRPDKGQDHFVGAMARLKDRGVAPVLLLAGAATAESAGYADGLRHLAAQAGVADRVRFLGYRDDVPDLMRAADLAVISSLVEGQPRVAVQAFASATPLVATRVGGVPEIVEHDVTGWLADPADPGSLADTIHYALADPIKKSVVAAKARRLAERTMRIDLRMEQTLATYAIAREHAWKRRFPRLRTE